MLLCAMRRIRLTILTGLQMPFALLCGCESSTSAASVTSQSGLSYCTVRWKTRRATVARPLGLGWPRYPSGCTPSYSANGMWSCSEWVSFSWKTHAIQARLSSPAKLFRWAIKKQSAVGKRGLSVVQSYCTRSVVGDHRRGYRLSCFLHSLQLLFIKGSLFHYNGSESEKSRWWMLACALTPTNNL